VAGDEPSKAVRLAEINRLHAAGDLSDEDHARLRSDILGGEGRGRRWSLLIVGIALAVVAAVGVVWWLGRSATDLIDAAPSAAPSPVSVAAQTMPVSTTDRVVTPVTSGPPVTVGPERRTFLIEQTIGHLRRVVDPISFASGLAKALDVRDGLLWAPNGLSSDRVLECARDRWIDFIGVRSLAEAAVDQALRESDAPAKVTALDVDDMLPSNATRDADGADEAAAITLFYECAGYSSEDAADLVDG
jgi:hypothetical protein